MGAERVLAGRIIGDEFVQPSSLIWRGIKIVFTAPNFAGIKDVYNLTQISPGHGILYSKCP